jgi:hypothetical protein
MLISSQTYARRTGNAVRDSDIRRPLVQWLLEIHGDQPDTAILEELEIPRPSSRIDLAAVNGRLSGYEIKSEADRLIRLQRQAPSFSMIFERMSIVTTAKHASTVAAHVPDWWEIVVWSSRGFRRKRRGKLNRQVNVENLCHVLHRRELFRVEVLAFGKEGPRAASKSELVQRLLEQPKRSRLLPAIRTVLKERVSA